MKFNKIISESFFDATSDEMETGSGRKKHSYIPFYINPDFSEMKEVIKVSEEFNGDTSESIRFIASNKTKELFVFPIDYLHYKAVNFLNSSAHPVTGEDREEKMRKFVYKTEKTISDPDIIFGDGTLSSVERKMIDININSVSSYIDEHSAKGSLIFLNKLIGKEGKWKWLEKYMDIYGQGDEDSMFQTGFARYISHVKNKKREEKMR